MISLRRILSCLPALLLCASLFAQNGPQLYNMSFDEWHKRKGVWYPYAADTPVSKRVWDSGNAGMHMLGMTSVSPDYEHVAVAGEGKAAARIESKKAAWAFIAGNVFTGRFVKIIDMSGAESILGTPFTARPKNLSGYYHYIPKKINHTKAPYKNMQGKSDEALIEVLLMDWDKPYTQITNRDGFIDSNNDPHIVGKASYIVKKGTQGYVKFDAPFSYRSSKTPRYVLFTLTGSRFGYAETGASGSVLYIDELQFGY